MGWQKMRGGISGVKVAENKIASYYSERGLVDNEYTIGASYQSMNGLIYLGGVKGITTFHPDSVTAQKGKSTVILSNLYLGGKSAWLMKTTRLRLSFPHWIIVILEIFSMNIVSESMKRTGPLLNWESIRLHTNI